MSSVKVVLGWCKTKAVPYLEIDGDQIVARFLRGSLSPTTLNFLLFYANKHLRAAAGLWSETNTSTFLRCEFGVLPVSLVVDRKALYFLWHLRRETWFRQYLLYLAHLPSALASSASRKYVSIP